MDAKVLQRQHSATCVEQERQKACRHGQLPHYMARPGRGGLRFEREREHSTLVRDHSTAIGDILSGL